jgi:hypothetical protein
VKGKEDVQWLPFGNQRDDDNAVRQKNQPASPLDDERWYEPEPQWELDFGYNVIPVTRYSLVSLFWAPRCLQWVD